jgi:hypothetical protein
MPTMTIQQTKKVSLFRLKNEQDKWTNAGQMMDIQIIHLSMQNSRTNGVWVYNTHTMSYLQCVRFG